MTEPTKGPSDPALVIAGIHAIAESLGFNRIRLDRQVYGPPDKPIAWAEVGYGCGEVNIRTSNASSYRFAPHMYMPDVVRSLLQSLVTQGVNGKC